MTIIIIIINLISWWIILSSWMQGPSRAGDAQQGPLVERGESSKFLTTLSQGCHIVVLSLSHRCHIVVTSLSHHCHIVWNEKRNTTIQTQRPLRIFEWRNLSMFVIKALMTNTKHCCGMREVKQVFNHIFVKHKHTRKQGNKQTLLSFLMLD